MAKRWAKLFIILGILAILIASLYMNGRRPAIKDPPLPTVDEISEMRASYYEHDLAKEIIFRPPEKTWDNILVAMLPAQIDREPAKWQVLGELKITLKNGDPFVVELYSVSNGLGAFAAGETIERRVYYRAGDSAKLKKALRNAYDASKNDQLRERDG